MNESLRNQFPILDRKVNGHNLVYLDNAATSQKPQDVLNAISDYYASYNSNIHRGAHTLANIATEAYEQSRESIRQFVNARSAREINFVRGTTEAINLVANAWGHKFLSEGDEIIVSAMEHHSNIVPWQMICERKGCKLKVIPLTPSLELDLTALQQLLSPKIKLLAVAYVSNALGVIHPVEKVIAMAHASGARVLIDAAQAAPHLKIDVQKLDADFVAFSGHKMYAPTGIGVLYGKEELLSEMLPWQGGGEMISEVTFEKTTYNQIPFKFEAGTPNIEGAIALRAAINWLHKTGMEKIAQHEKQLHDYTLHKMLQIEGVEVMGTSPNKASVISFLVRNVHPFDVGAFLNQYGIAIRTGHHCCQPLMQRLGIEGTCRLSFAAYNTMGEVDYFLECLQKVIAKLR